MKGGAVSDQIPRELGLLSGSTWARHTTARQVELVADTGAIPATVVVQTLAAGMADRLAEYDADRESDFWAGFVQGVKGTFVESLQAGSKQN